METLYYTSFSGHNGEYREYYGPVIGKDGEKITLDPAPRYPDEYLEFWGRMYIDNHLTAHNVLFETFLEAPQDILNAIAARHDDSRTYGHNPRFLLPKQLQAARSAELQTPLGLQQELDRNPSVVRRNGMYFEPLHHTTWPRHASRRIG